MPSAVELSVVVPIHNEVENLRELHTRLTSVLQGRGTYELIFVDDASTDGSRAILRSLAQEDAHVEVIVFCRNFGQHPALMAGMQRADGDVVVFMDGDLQDRPEEIPRLLAVVAQGNVDIACAVRRKRRDTWFKRYTSALYLRFISRLMGMDVSLTGATFRAVRRRVVLTMRTLSECNNHVMLLMSWLGYSTALVEVEHASRSAGATKYPLLRLLRHAADGVVSFTLLPLRLAVSAGLGIAVLACLLGFCFLCQKLFWGIDVAGWTSIMVSLFFLGGVLLAFLGVIGEYVGRIFMEIKGRPRYVVAETWGAGPNSVVEAPHERRHAI